LSGGSILWQLVYSFSAKRQEVQDIKTFLFIIPAAFPVILFDWSEQEERNVF